MSPAAVVAILWLLFGGSHIGLAVVRERLSRRLGEVGFIAVFYVVAAGSFAALVMYYAQHRFDGPLGLALGRAVALRWVLIGLALLGMMFMVPALMIYPRLPSALFTQRTPRVQGIERITRHPFFAGMGLFALAHALLATHLSGTVFFTGFLLLSAIGAWHQDRKLLARRGAPYAEYLAATSGIPFGTVLAGRQKLALQELDVGPIAIGFGLALALRYWHASLFAAGGVWIVAVVLVGAMFAGASAWRRSRSSVEVYRLASKDVSYRRP